MLWKYRWSLLQSATNRIFRKLPLQSFRYLSSPSLCGTDEAQNSFPENVDRDFSHKIKLSLTHQIVYSTLSNCPSDIIALSFFLWCAKQHNYFHNSVAFDYMVTIVTRLTERHKTVKGILGELECVGCATKAQTLLFLLRIYWRGGTYGMVLEAYEQMGDCGFTPNTFASNVLMDVLFKIGRADVAMKVWKETQVPNFLTCNIALLHLCKINDVIHIQNVLRVMLRMDYYPKVEIFEMLLNCFCKMSRLVEAYQVLGLMISLGITMSVNIWSILINGFCRMSELGVASNLLEKMEETGCSPNVVTYTILVKAFMESEMVPDAVGILHTMKSKGCTPDIIFCNVLIDCLSKIERYQDGLEVFRSLPKQNLAPDSYTYSSLLYTIRMSRRFYLLPKLVHGLVIDADLVLCNSLLSYFCKAGRPSLAVELYNDMVDRGFMPDRYSFTGLLSGLCGAGRIDEAINVYHGIIMNYPGIDAHIHTAITDGLIKVGKCNSAIKLFRKAIMEKYPLDVVSYTVAIHGLLRGGRIGEACAMYNQMKEVGLTPNLHTYSVMLSALCKERDLKMVKQMLREMIDERIELDYNNLVRLSNFFGRSHHYLSGFSLLAEMRGLELIKARAMQALFVNELLHGVKADDECYTLMKGYAENYEFEDSSNSGDHLDVVASVG
ncbi:Pentatricopeptide repeat [Quillaja saponaria]|uniref:Pentatricopeptide repeat n=1 Tax=Quillaja saponaria TaxID=32244 RepID=A0AAD7L5Q1_QUISA|nr:Pentatricopeptide repeat [Quillaja saponaria]KAJ7952069.1 Pentatricopeptide repeat [Quillaja saponaria]